MTNVPGFVLLVLALAGVAAPSVERGRTLFGDKSLGTNGRTCASCHEGGKRLEDLGEYDDVKLGEYANTCIKGMLKGKPLAPGSVDLRSLVLYLRTFRKDRGR